MPRLPDVTDYGARPSLRSNRVDPVHPSGVEVAEAVSQAASTFAGMLSEKKQKDSRLQYALAKNEILALDISQREGLKERDDYDAFDEDYTNGFNTGRDEILGRYSRLSPTDRALLSSESDLIREKGRVYAGDLAKGIEIDQGRATVQRTLDEFLESVQIAPPEQQNELMGQALETVMAALDEGWYTNEEAESLLQGFVAKAATDSLDNMDKEQMIAEIKLSLAHRKARGAITRDEIVNGEGSGSVADFLHANELEEMLESAEEQLKNENEYDIVYGIIDDVLAEFSGTDAEDLERQHKEAVARLDPNQEGYGDLRNTLETELAQAQNRKAGIRQLRESEAALEVTNWVDDQVATDPETPPTIAQLRSMEIWTRLSPQGRKAAEDYVRLRAEGHEYALADDDDFLLEWVQMSPEDQIKMMPEFDSMTVKSRLTRNTWEQLLGEARQRRDSQERPGPANIWRGDQQDEVLQNMLVGEEGLFRRVPTPGSPDDARYRRIDAEVNRRITQESVDRYRETGNGQMYPEDIDRITSQVLRREIYLRGGWFDEDRRTVMADVIRFDVQTDPQGRPVATGVELEEDAARAFIPYEDWAGELSDVPDPSGQGFLTTEQMLRNFADNPEGVGRKDLEEAYFYLNALPEASGMEYARRRIRGEMGPGGEEL